MDPSNVFARIVNRPALCHALVVAFILVAVFGLIEPLDNAFAEQKAHEWIGAEEDSLAKASTLTAAGLNAEPVDQVIADQVVESRRGALMHLKIAEYFFVKYYVAVFMASLLALCAAICFGLISRGGWSAANPYLVTAFIVLSAQTAYFAAQPSLYQQPQNIDSNKHIYSGYKSIFDDIELYAAERTSRSVTNVRQPAQDFASATAKRLADLRSLPISFNPSAVGELQRSLQQAMSDNLTKPTGDRPEIIKKIP